MPPGERIATFDQDGTLWVEHPVYSQFIYCLDRVAAAGEEKPELAKVEPFKTVLSGDREAIAQAPRRGPPEDRGRHALRHDDEEFQAQVERLARGGEGSALEAALHGLTYLPMQEVLKYLRANGYKTYIVTGGGQDFVRMFSERVYGIPPEQVVGTAARRSSATIRTANPT